MLAETSIEFIIIFRFFVSRLNDEFPCLHFRRLLFVFTQKAIEKVFKMLFVIKNANRKTIFRVFLNTILPFACNSLRHTVRSEF